MSRFCWRFILCTLLGGLPFAAPVDTWADAGGESTPPRILVFGDSLSAAYGIEIDAGWVALLQQRLRAQGKPHRLVNASVSGETSAGGRARLPALLAREPYALVVLELGGNDGLRGLSLAQTEANLRAMIEAARGTGAQVLLLGMRLPPNYGATYTNAFAAIYPKLAREQDVALVPFLLDGVATDLALMQPDRIHPRAAAQPRLLDTVWPALVPLL
ncbi:MAG: arylesterase [Gammaproteobacteria bacterium]|nr:arylesterase [Gammaproteobacteria bacterium]